MLRICIFGAAGRMGQTIAAECLSGYAGKIKIVSGVDAPNSPGVGKTFADGAKIFSSNEIDKALKEVDCTLNFTAPEAEVQNVPKIVALGKNIVVGTTGLTEEQIKTIRQTIEKSKVAAVISPNFSPLVNAQMLLTRRASEILAPLGYDFAIVEEHHTGKKDAPSGTAKKLAQLISNSTNSAPKKLVFRQEGLKAKERGELDMAALRLGGSAGQHEVRIVGPAGRLTIESLMYSRADFAKGAIESALWLQKNAKAGKIFSMEDILNLK